MLARFSLISSISGSESSLLPYMCVHACCSSSCLSERFCTPECCTYLLLAIKNLYIDAPHTQRTSNDCNHFETLYD